jgi:biopolymer transport protein TolQ
MSQRIVPFVAMLFGVCAFISITAYGLYLNTAPQFVIECTGCNGHGCDVTADIEVWGVMQKLSSVALVTYCAMYLHLACVIAIVVERWLTYYDAERQTEAYAAKMTAAIEAHRLNEARSLAADYPKSPLAAVVHVSLHPAGVCTTEGEAPSMDAWHHAVAVKTSELRRRLWELSAAGWTMPLLGILLLVFGFISTLQGMKAAEGTGICALAGGIAEALRATVFSLLFGIPALWSYKYLNAKCNRLALEMGRRSLALINQIARLPQAIQAGKALRPYDTQPLDLRVTEHLTDR